MTKGRVVNVYDDEFNLNEKRGLSERIEGVWDINRGSVVILLSLNCFLVFVLGGSNEDKRGKSKSSKEGRELQLKYKSDKSRG